MHFDIYPSPNASKILSPLLYPPSFVSRVCVCVFVCTLLCAICIVHILRYVAIHWIKFDLLAAPSLQKTDSPFLRSYQLPIVPQFGLGFHAQLLCQCWKFV